ncbi:MAG: hypothetical protein IT261_06765, partial [Saprospiraceae bacterium]|nr:hypothetical protein [Saprospiraceae bacterium]
QGWVYTLLFSLLIHHFLTAKQIENGRYVLQFYITIAVLIGVLVSFVLQGYGLYSIIFSTLFQGLNYWFAYRFLNDVRPLENTVALRLVKAGIYFGLLSTLLPFGIGYLSARGQGGTEIYDSFVYTFMHLQYNGWFLFIALGLFYQIQEKNNRPFHQPYALMFYRLFSVACIPAISLSLLGMSFSHHLTIIAWVVSVVQFIGLVFFLLSIRGSIVPWLKLAPPLFGWFMIGFLASFTVKVTLQSASVLPFLKSVAFFNKNILLAYLHLSLIGTISFLLLALIMEMKWLVPNRITWLGSILLCSGFLATELLLVSGGLGIFDHQMSLVMGSLAMAVGVLCLVMSPARHLHLR